MAQWEIRLLNGEPVRVEVEEQRNLSEEYAAFDAHHDSFRRWAFWKQRPSPYWQVTEAVVIHKDAVVGVLPRKPKIGRARIGFM